MAGNDRWRVYRPGGGVEPGMKPLEAAHEKNWLDCIKSRQKPNSDVEIGRLSTMLCHLGNISYKLGRDVRFDGDKEDFGKDREANALLRRECRRPYEPPKV